MTNCNFPATNFNIGDTETTIINKIPQLFIANPDNDDLFKLLKYDTSNALSQPNLTQEEKVQFIRPLVDYNESGIMRHAEFVSQVVQDTVTQIRIFLKNDSAEDNRLAKVFIGIDAVCHNDLVLLDGGKGRLFELKNAIQKSLSGQNIGIGQFYYNGCTLLNYNDKFQAYKMIFSTRST